MDFIFDIESSFRVLGFVLRQKSIDRCITVLCKYPRAARHHEGAGMPNGSEDKNFPRVSGESNGSISNEVKNGKDKKALWHFPRREVKCKNVMDRITGQRCAGASNRKCTEEEKWRVESKKGLSAAHSPPRSAARAGTRLGGSGFARTSGDREDGKQFIHVRAGTLCAGYLRRTVRDNLFKLGAALAAAILKNGHGQIFSRQP
jgi:hypothetical protein